MRKPSMPCVSEFEIGEEALYLEALNKYNDEMWLFIFEEYNNLDTETFIPFFIWLKNNYPAPITFKCQLRISWSQVPH